MATTNNTENGKEETLCSLTEVQRMDKLLELKRNHAELLAQAQAKKNDIYNLEHDIGNWLLKQPNRIHDHSSGCSFIVEEQKTPCSLTQGYIHKKLKAWFMTYYSKFFQNEAQLTLDIDRMVAMLWKERDIEKILVLKVKDKRRHPRLALQQPVLEEFSATEFPPPKRRKNARPAPSLPAPKQEVEEQEEDEHTEED